MQHLRRDWRLDNLAAYDPAAAPPPLDTRGLEGFQVGLAEIFFTRCARAAGAGRAAGLTP